MTLRWNFTTDFLINYTRTRKGKWMDLYIYKLLLKPVKRDASKETGVKKTLYNYHICNNCMNVIRNGCLVLP
jgi:hypothetical protein